MYNINKIFPDGEQVLNLEEKVDLLSVDVQDACCVEDILVCEDKLKLLDEENELWPPYKPLEVVKKMEEMNLISSELVNITGGRHEIDPSLQKSPEEDCDAQRMRLDYREDRLLLHSIAHPADGHLSFKVCNGLVVMHTSLYFSYFLGTIFTVKHIWISCLSEYVLFWW